MTVGNLAVPLVLLGLAAAWTVLELWRRGWRVRPVAAPHYLAAQLEAVRRSEWRRSGIMNRVEWRLYWLVVHELLSGEFFVFPQVALGEVLHTEDAEAYRAINSKRCDLLLTDRNGFPVAVVEYQGSGHNLNGTAAWRDEIKREAVERAGMEYLEIRETDTPDDIRSALRSFLPRAKPGNSAAA